ncbi:MAG: GspE/PulE family protein [Pseudomonadota bacterium]
MVGKIKLGDLLVEKQVITEQQLKNALKSQRLNDKKLGETLIDLGFTDEKTLLNFLSEQLGFPVIDLAKYELDYALTRQLPESHARRFRAILLAEESDGKYLVGMVDPLDILAVDELSLILEHPLKLALVREADLKRSLDTIYRRKGEIDDFAEQLEQELDSSRLEEAEAIALADTSVLKLLRSVFEDAVQVGASDIHIEPFEDVVRIRLRVDGELQEQTIDEKRVAAALSQRLKLMAGLNMAEKRLPQDGRFNITVKGMPIDVRLSTMPIQYGESIVMRLLNQAEGFIQLDRIGMSTELLKQFRDLIKLPYGIVLVTGPTGSGKTTTLYGAISEINDIKRKILTIEDPVEYRIDRVNQIQVNAQLGLTFARVLRSSLRQDPDIILVGEIRDQETAEIAMRAALTGHLVLATLHTNNAVTSPLRLIDMGVAGYLVAATTRAILAQRLVRRICHSCKTEYIPEPQDEAYFREVLGERFDQKKYFHGTGCSQCNYTGYRGRTGVFELLEIKTTMVDPLRRNDSGGFEEAVRNEKSFKTLLDYGFDLVIQGETTLHELMRVAGEQE